MPSVAHSAAGISFAGIRLSLLADIYVRPAACFVDSFDGQLHSSDGVAASFAVFARDWKWLAPSF